MALAVALGALGLIAFAVLGGGGSGGSGPTRTAEAGTDTPAAPPPSPAAPSPARVNAAAAYARARTGNVSFAVVDTAGEVHGLEARRRFASASVVKAMILVAYLDHVRGRGEQLSDGERAELGEMIRRSDNAPAARFAATVGDDGLNAVARRAGMSNTRPQAAPWGLTETDAADQARLFARIDEIVPSPEGGFVRRLLGSVVPEHRWGIPRAAPDGSKVLFKGGWLPDDEGAWRVHQVARVERGDRRLALAVMTDDNPSQDYGEETVRGVAERLLR